MTESTQAPAVVPGAGLALTSRNVLERTSPVRWMTREAPRGPQDSGWRILSMSDTPEYMAQEGNLLFVDFNVILMAEPALAPIYALPVGSELMLHVDDTGAHIIDSTTNEELPADQLAAFASQTTGAVREWQPNEGQSFTAETEALADYGARMFHIVAPGIDLRAEVLPDGLGVVLVHPVRGGGSLYVAPDQSLLFAASSAPRAEALEVFRSGRRTPLEQFVPPAQGQGR